MEKRWMKVNRRKTEYISNTWAQLFKVTESAEEK